MKRLITDHDVMTGALSPPLVLDDNTLITPSARDRAARMGWAVVEAGARSARATPDCSGAPGCGRCGSGACTGSCGGPAGAGPAGGCGGCGKAVCDGQCGRGGGSAGACGGGLADGLYLVRIEGGRRVAVLPAAGPGVMARSLAAVPSLPPRYGTPGSGGPGGPGAMRGAG